MLRERLPAGRPDPHDARARAGTPTAAVLSSLKILVRAQVACRQRTLRRKAEAKLIRQAAAGDLQVATRFWLARKSMVCAVSHATALPPAAALRGRV